MLRFIRWLYSARPLAVFPFCFQISSLLKRHNLCTSPKILRPLTVSFKFKDFQGVCGPWVGMILQEMPEFFSTINITNIFVSKKEKHSSLDMLENILRTLPKIRSRRRRLSISCRKVLYLPRPLQQCILNFLWVAVVASSSKWQFLPVAKVSRKPCHTFSTVFQGLVELWGHLSHQPLNLHWT